MAFVEVCFLAILINKNKGKKVKQLLTGIVGGTIAFTLIGCLTTMAALDKSFEFGMLVGGLSIGLFITAVGGGVTRLFGRTELNTLCYSLSVAAVAAILFFVMSLAEFNNGAPLGALVVGGYGLVTGLVASCTARTLAGQTSNTAEE